MKTFMAKPADVERKWFVVDAAGIPLGRVASQVADILTGKNKPSYTPHIDNGDFVIVLNSDKIVLTGKKAVDKNLDGIQVMLVDLKKFNTELLWKRTHQEQLRRRLKACFQKHLLEENKSQDFMFTKQQNTTTKHKNQKRLS